MADTSNSYPEYANYQAYSRYADLDLRQDDHHSRVSEYDAFSNVVAPAEYLEAPPTITPMWSEPTTVDPDYFEISPLANVHDSMSLHFLVQTSIADAKGFKLLSYNELDDLKKVSGARLFDCQGR
jgi:hypothetical protein